MPLVLGFACITDSLLSAQGPGIAAESVVKSAPADEVGSIEAAKESQPLGQLRVGETRSIHLPIARFGPSPLSIKAVEASCGCMQVLGYPERVDERAEISLRYIALREGAVSVRVIIETSDPSQRFVEFTFTGTVVAGDRSRAIMIEAIAPELFAHRNAVIPEGLLISGAEARKLVERGAVLIDVRNPAERAGTESINAMEIPLHELRSKPFFAARSAVLLGSGVLSERTLETIVALPTEGKSRIYYIDGGFGAWAAAGGTNIPKKAASAPVSTSTISATELHAAADRGHYLLVDATGDDLASIYLPEAERLSTPAGDVAMMNVALAKLRAAAPRKTLLVVTKDASAQRKAEEAVRDPAICFLDGGLAAYREFLAGQTQALLARRDGRNLVHARQGAMTKSFPRELLSSGCSSCPGRH